MALGPSATLQSGRVSGAGLREPRLSCSQGAASRVLGIMVQVTNPHTAQAFRPQHMLGMCLSRGKGSGRGSRTSTHGEDTGWQGGRWEGAEEGRHHNKWTSLCKDTGVARSVVRLGTLQELSAAGTQQVRSEDGRGQDLSPSARLMSPSHAWRALRPT